MAFFHSYRRAAAAMKRKRMSGRKNEIFRCASERLIHLSTSWCAESSHGKEAPLAALNSIDVHVFRCCTIVEARYDKRTDEWGKY